MEASPKPPSSELLQAARYDSQGDQFVGFWLELTIAGRQYELTGNPRPGRATIDRFYKIPQVQKALAEDPEGLVEELRNAAVDYLGTCRDDPQYSSLVWRMNRLESEQLRTKVVRDCAKTVVVIVGSGAHRGAGGRLSGALAMALRDAFGQVAVNELRALLSKDPVAAHLLEPPYSLLP